MSDLPNHGIIEHRYKDELRAKQTVCWCIKEKRQFSADFDEKTGEWTVAYAYIKPVTPKAA